MHYFFFFLGNRSQVITFDDDGMEVNSGEVSILQDITPSAYNAIPEDPDDPPKTLSQAFESQGQGVHTTLRMNHVSLFSYFNPY